MTILGLLLGTWLVSGMDAADGCWGTKGLIIEVSSDTSGFSLAILFCIDTVKWRQK